MAPRPTPLAPVSSFDPGFKPNYWLGVNIGTPYLFYLDYAQLWPGGTNAIGHCTNGYYVGSSGDTDQRHAHTAARLPIRITSRIHSAFKAPSTIATSNGIGGSYGCVYEYGGGGPFDNLPNSLAATSAVDRPGIRHSAGGTRQPDGGDRRLRLCRQYNGAQPGNYMSNQILPPIDPTSAMTNSCG